MPSSQNQDEENMKKEASRGYYNLSDYSLATYTLHRSWPINHKAMQGETEQSITVGSTEVWIVQRTVCALYLPTKTKAEFQISTTIST